MVGGDTHVYRIVNSLDEYRVNKDSDNITHGFADKKDNTPPTHEFIQNTIDKMTSPMQIKIKQVLWSSYFGINERLANGFRRGRAFLIGGKIL